MAGFKIGDVFLGLRAEDGGLRADVQREAAAAGDAGSQTLGQRITRAFKTEAPRAFGAVAAAGFALATKGALELQTIQGQYQADTGASAEEAARAAKVISRAAGDERLALEEVGDAAARVHNDLGSVGDEADDLTRRFARYARVTKQQAGAAVSEFDDILDAWGLEATDSGRIMDALVASHQEYGGEIADNQKALAELAPQLRALGADVDDGVALLNLFAASGLDASKATFALNTAVQKLEPGEGLDDLFARISAIEDPTERAQAAVELFGARGGVSLANVLRPGVDSLDDFTVDMDQAAGATDRAAEALDSAFPARLQKLISQAGARIRELGADFGPAVTGAASLASLFGTLFPGLGSRVARGFASVGTRAGGAFARAFTGSKLGAAITTGLSSAMDRVAGTPAIKGATGKLGTFLGSSLGKAVSIAFAAAAVLAVFETYRQIEAGLNEQSAQIGKDVGSQITAGTTESLEQSKAALQQGIDELAGLWYNPFAGGQKAQLEQQLAAVDAELQRRASETPEALAERLEEGKARIEAAAGEMVDPITGEVIDAREDAAAEAAKTPGEIADGILSQQALVGDAMEALRRQMEEELSPAAQATRDIGALVSTELAAGLDDKRPGVRAAAQQVQETAEAELAEFIANGGTIGKKGMDQLNAGLRSKDPAVRENARRTKAIIEGGIKPNTRPAGVAAGSNIASGLSSQDTKVAIAAANLARTVIRTIIGTVSSANDSFRRTGQPGSGFRHLASGGFWPAGHAAWIGEEGPEIAVPAEDMYVIPHERSLEMVGAGVGVTNITIPVELQGLLPARDPFEAATQMARVARTGLRSPRVPVPEFRSPR